MNFNKVLTKAVKQYVKDVKKKNFLIQNTHIRQ